MSQIRKGALSTIFLIILTIIVVLSIYFVYNWWQATNAPKPIKAIDFSLNPTDITVSQNATIKITIENQDLRNHEIKIYFIADPRVTFYEPIEEQLIKDGLKSEYIMQIESVQTSISLQFYVKGELPGRVSVVGYPISLEVFVDGMVVPITWGDQILTIRN